MPACRRRRPSSLWEDGSPTWAGRDQWPYAVLTGADVVNRAIGASYGEVAGIARTVRDYAAGVGPAVLGTMLTHATTDNVVNTLESRGVPPGEARAVARQVTETVPGGGGTRVPEGSGEAGAAMRDAVQAVRMDFAQADQRVLYGMAVALGITFPIGLSHPGGRTGAAPAPQDERRTGAPAP